MTGYSLDMELYKKPDYRCLKPKPGLPSSKWPHYDMEQFRAAKTEKELQKVEEIPFNKEPCYSNHENNIVLTRSDLPILSDRSCHELNLFHHRHDRIIRLTFSISSILRTPMFGMI